MNRFLQVFYILFSAGMLAMGIPNEFILFGCPLFTVFSLIPFYITISRSKSWREVFLLSFLFFLSIHLFSSFWLGFFKDYPVQTLGASALETAFIGAALSLLFYLPFSRRTARRTLEEGAGLYTGRISFRIIWFAVAYTVYEWVKSTGFLGYPWGTLSLGMYRARILAQITDITGTYGITFLVAFFAALCGEGIELVPRVRNAVVPRRMFKVYRNTALCCASLFACAFAYGIVQYLIPRTPQKYVNLVMVQQNSDEWIPNTEEPNILLSEQKTSEKKADFETEDRKINLVIWSEGVLQHSFPSSSFFYENYPSEKPLLPFIRQTGVPFIIGGPYRIETDRGAKHINAALLFDKDGIMRGAYGKMHLVPFAETIPGADIPWVINLMNALNVPVAGWEPGSQYVYFDVPCSPAPCAEKPSVKVFSLKKTPEQQTAEDNESPYARISVPICYDDAFPADVMRPLFMNGAELFLNMSDDSWSMTKSGEVQHYAVASYRAIEYRTTLVRSTNAGYSAVVDASGRKIFDMPLFEAAGGAVQVPVYKRYVTVYAKLGNWVIYIFLALSAVYSIFCMFFFAADQDRPTDAHWKKHAKKTAKRESCLPPANKFHKFSEFCLIYHI